MSLVFFVSLHMCQSTFPGTSEVALQESYFSRNLSHISRGIRYYLILKGKPADKTFFQERKVNTERDTDKRLKNFSFRLLIYILQVFESVQIFFMELFHGTLSSHS
jgi:hypothetical protein